MKFKNDDYVYYNNRIYSVMTTCLKDRVTLVNYDKLNHLYRISTSSLEIIPECEIVELRKSGKLPPRKFKVGDIVKLRVELDDESVDQISFRKHCFKLNKGYVIDRVSEYNICKLTIHGVSFHEFEVQLIDGWEEMGVFDKICEGDYVMYKDKICVVDNYLYQLVSYEVPRSFNSDLHELKKLSNIEIFNLKKKGKLPKRRLKVGDKVKIRVDLDSRSFYLKNLLRDVGFKENEEYIVEKVSDKPGRIIISGNKDHNILHEFEVELVEES